MGKIFRLILALMLIFSLCGCKEKQNTIHQLTNQSESQMMSYVLTTKNGDCFVFDGGTQEDEAYLIDYIQSHDDNATVNGWFLTHYHKDHTGALAQFLESGSDEIKIENIYYSFPTDASLVETYDETRIEDYNRILNDLSTLDYAHTIYDGFKVETDELTIEVINDMQIYYENFGNNTSSVYKITSDTTSWLVLGDCGSELAQYLIDNHYEDIHNVDYLQMAHHGQRGGSSELYHVINPKVCLWPLTDWIYTNWSGTGDLRFDETYEWMKDIDRIDYYAKDGTQEIEFK